MKNRNVYILILIVGLMVPFGISQAQTVSPLPAVEGASVTAEESLNLQELKDQPLAARRQIVLDELRSIAARLNTIYDKTKIALDRLAQKGIDTTAAQTELAKAATELANAKIAIDAFADPEITFKQATTQSNPLREAAVKAETDLKESREHIIQTLLLLKIAIGAPSTQ